MAYARHIGRIGALAVMLGVGAALVTTPAVGFAQPTDSGSNAAADAEATSDAGSASRGAAADASLSGAGHIASAADGTDGAGGTDIKAATGDRRIAPARRHRTAKNRPLEAPALADAVTADLRVIKDRALKRLAGPETTAVPAVTSGGPAVATTPQLRSVLPDIPHKLAAVTSQLVSLAPTSLLAGGAPGAPAPSPLMWTVLTRMRRETELALLGNAPFASIGQVDAATPDLLANPVSDWFQRYFDAATPTFPTQAVSLGLNPGDTGSVALGGEDADGRSLIYRIGWRTRGTGTEGGTLVISGDTATYTPPSDWNGVDTYTDSFTVTTSDIISLPHLHGVPGLVHLLTFGLFGDGGHTATGTVNVTVSQAAAGTFPVTLVNNSKGAYRSDDIYITVIGQSTSGNWAWVDQNGTLVPLDANAATAPGHLEKDGVDYANMSFTLKEGGNLRMPANSLSMRIYLSIDQPLYLAIFPGNTGYTTPDGVNPADPNYDTAYDWYELSFVNGSTAFGGNTTQVDAYGLPFTFTLTQDSSDFSATRGIRALAPRLLFLRYQLSVPREFRALVIRDGLKPLRIASPKSTTPGGLATYLDEPINDFWTTYADKQFTYTTPDYSVTGQVNASGEFAYTLTTGGVGTNYTMQKPTTPEVFQCSGPFVGPNNAQGSFLAAFGAAFNRGVASTPDKWDTVSAYYPRGTKSNAYSKFFHEVSVDGLAYGFPFDDVNNQSSSVGIGNTQPPTNLKIVVQ